MITVRHIEKTCLESEPFFKLCKKHASKLEKDLLIVFDLRIGCYGTHWFDSKKQLHIIRISPEKCRHYRDEKGVIKKLDLEAEKYNIISTVVHEIRHAQQKEEMGISYWNKKCHYAEEIRNPGYKSYYSEIEADARTYENKYVLSAVEFYNSCVS